MGSSPELDVSLIWNVWVNVQEVVTNIQQTDQEVFHVQNKSWKTAGVKSINILSNELT